VRVSFGFILRYSFIQTILAAVRAEHLRYYNIEVITIVIATIIYCIFIAMFASHNSSEVIAMLRGYVFDNHSSALASWVVNRSSSVRVI
jgi:uncharacterized membrane protein YukC